jgi:hypothetical protein
MDSDLKSHLDAMEQRLGQGIDDAERRMRLHVSEAINASETRMKANVVEAVYHSETKLLSEFWKWARTADARYRQSQVT